MSSFHYEFHGSRHNLCFRLILFALTATAKMPDQFSPDEDGVNQDILQKYFGDIYYRDRFAGILPAEQRAELKQLILMAREHPVLALGAAQAIYMYGWYTGIKEPTASAIDWENAAAAAELFEQSILYGECDRSDMKSKEFVARGCEVRWSHAIILHAYLAQAFRGLPGDASRALAHDQKANVLISHLKKTDRFQGACCKHWSRPLDFNFNAAFFPDVPSAAVWSTNAKHCIMKKRPSIAEYLEERYMELRKELEPIFSLPKEEWSQYAPGSVNSEHLAAPGGWHMLAIVRHGEWNTLLCDIAPRTCEIIGSRPEVSNCTVSNSNIMYLGPGGTVKPHFGNAPRLALHLALSAPEPEAAYMQVGNEVVRWQEGEVVVFDDTHAHWVTHLGTKPRYVLNVWFCHPCDTNPIHSHGQECIV
jgi:hypothetical protein